MKWINKHPKANTTLETVKFAEKHNLLDQTPYQEKSIFGKIVADLSGAFFRLVDEFQSASKGKLNPITTIHNSAVALQGPALLLETYFESKYPNDKELHEKAGKLGKQIRAAMNVIYDTYDHRNLGNRNILALKAHRTFTEEIITPLKEFYQERGMIPMLAEIDKHAKQVNQAINNSHEICLN